MDPVYTGLFGFLALLILIALNVPVTIAMAVPGLLGLFYLMGFQPTFEILTSQTFTNATTFEFTAVPLFLLMGYTAMNAKIVSSAYDSARIWTSRLPGGLSIATCAASGVLGACMGSGIPAAAAMARIAVPEMLRYNYDKSLAVGSVAASATVAVLIPPSVIMVIYAIFTEISLGKMLLAGYIPGILSVFIYAAMIAVRVWLNPDLAPTVNSNSITWRQLIQAVKGVWGVAILFLVMLVGIYTGFFTATEAAAVSALTAFILMFITRSFKWSRVKASFLETLEVTAMALLMLVGAAVFSVFIGVSGLPKMLANWIVSANMPMPLFMITIMILYLFLGCILPTISMMLVTLPVILPVLVALDVNLIWFGIVFIKTAEVGGITPPFGISVYVVKGVVGDSIPTETIFRGIGWFIAMDILTLAMLLIFPQLSLWLPNLMRGA